MGDFSICWFRYLAQVDMVDYEVLDFVWRRFFVQRVVGCWTTVTFVIICAFSLQIVLLSSILQLIWATNMCSDVRA